MSTTASVLVLDDDADILQASRLALARYAAHVETASSPERLEDTLAAHPFDVVLLDMNFAHGVRNGRDGMNALARIRSFDATLSVVLMTAYGGVALAVDGLKAGACDFILKPWQNAKLVSAVTSAVERTQMMRRAENLDLDSIERLTIERALAKFSGNISAAAEALGISRAALYRRMEKYGL